MVLTCLITRYTNRWGIIRRQFEGFILPWRQFCNVSCCQKEKLLCAGNNVEGWNMMWNIIFHSLLALHWWPYATLCCTCVRSWRAWPYSKLWPRSALRTVVDGPPCQTLSLLSYLSGPHTFKWTHFVITSSQRNIIELSCSGTSWKLGMLLEQNMQKRWFPHFVTVDVPHKKVCLAKILTPKGS